MILLSRLREKVGAGGLAIALILLVAVIFVMVSMLRDLGPTQVDTAIGKHFGCTVISVYDGDGPINCAEVDKQGKPVSVRFRGIEAREPDDSCQVAVCPPLSGAQAKAIATKLAVGRMQCTSYGPSYNRVDAACFSASGVDISCELIKTGAAVRWPEYDRDGRLVKCVPPPKR